MTSIDWLCQTGNFSNIHASDLQSSAYRSCSGADSWKALERRTSIFIKKRQDETHIFVEFPLRQANKHTNITIYGSQFCFRFFFSEAQSLQQMQLVGLGDQLHMRFLLSLLSADGNPLTPSLFLKVGYMRSSWPYLHGKISLPLTCWRLLFFWWWWRW